MSAIDTIRLVAQRRTIGFAAKTAALFMILLLATNCASGETSATDEETGEAQEAATIILYGCSSGGTVCSTTSGGGTWGSILNMKLVVTNNSTGTFTITKKDNSKFGAGTVSLRVGSPDGPIHGTPFTAPANTYSSLYIVESNFAFYKGTYPKDYYLRFESSGGGYAYAGPIKVYENVVNSL